jgi:dihydroorotate dehydrogenase (fumarate)
MDLSTTYMGLELRHPIVPSASPLSVSLDDVRRLEDAGAPAIVLYSLFEEQINRDNSPIDRYLTTNSESTAQALGYFPKPADYHNRHASEYLEHISRIREAVGIPVIASLNGVSQGGWLEYACRMEEAGAHGIELNIYYINTDPAITSHEVEKMYLDDVRAVKQSLGIPVAVKLGPYFSSLANVAVQLDHAGADALVLFNRFYQPDIDLENLRVNPTLELSNLYEKRLPMRWIAILHGQLTASLAASTGIHSAEDAIKMILCGADVAMVTSVLLQNGIEYLETLVEDMEQWMAEREFTSISRIKGTLSAKSLDEPAAFERANYLKIIQSYSSIKRPTQGERNDTGPEH